MINCCALYIRGTRSPGSLALRSPDASLTSRARTNCASRRATTWCRRAESLSTVPAPTTSTPALRAKWRAAGSAPGLPRPAMSTQTLSGRSIASLISGRESAWAARAGSSPEVTTRAGEAPGLGGQELMRQVKVPLGAEELGTDPEAAIRLVNELTDRALAGEFEPVQWLGARDSAAAGLASPVSGRPVRLNASGISAVRGQGSVLARNAADPGRTVGDDGPEHARRGRQDRSPRESGQHFPG